MKKMNSYQKLQSRNKFLVKTSPIIIIILLLTLYTFSTEISSTTKNDVVIVPYNDVVINDTEKPDINTPITYNKYGNEEKFMTYLPHSGFHNQHGSLMNAIMLSYLTNRTLIIPPVLIYQIDPYGAFYPLYYKLNRTTRVKKYRMEHCKNDSLTHPTLKDNDEDNEDNESYLYNPSMLCNEKFSKYDRFTMINWDQVFDFSQVEKYIKIVYRGYDFSLTNLQEKFNASDDDTFLFVENEQYEFRFFDDDKSKKSLQNFKHKVLLSDLLKIDQKLLHFSSLFGSHRISIEKKENFRFYHIIHDSLMINDPRVLKVTDQIIKELGGNGTYFGLHVRVGDAVFKKFEEDNINLIYDKLNKSLLKLDLIKNKKNSYFYYNLEECKKENLPIIYIATDSTNPKDEFRKFYDNIPCVFTLFDFEENLKNLAGKIFSDFDENVDLLDFYIPIIDLLITSHGRIFIGTPGSTFSRMADEVHKLYIN